MHLRMVAVVLLVALGTGALASEVHSGDQLDGDVRSAVAPRNSVVYPEAAYYHNGGNVVDVTKAPFHADNSGASDCTAALVAAYDFAMGGVGANDDPGVILYLPDGTYLVSDTIVYSGPVEIVKGHERLQKIRIRGESREGTIIRLADHAAGYGPGRAKPVVSFGKHTQNNNVATNKCENLTIDTGVGNPGAIGLLFTGANNSAVRDLSIRSGDESGMVGLDLPMGVCQGYYARISVDGFDYGIRKTRLLASSVFLEHIVLRGQNIAGVQVNDGMVTLRKVSSRNTVPALELSDPFGLTVVIDSDLRCAAGTGPAIVVNKGHLLARNLTVAGYDSAIQDGSGAVLHPAGPVDEYVTQAYALFGTDSSATTLNLPIENTPMVEWETDLANWASVTQFGGTPGDDIDDTEAIQKALSSGKPVVWFPAGRYLVSGSVTVPATVRRINFMYSEMDARAPLENQEDAPVFIVEPGGTPLLMEDMRSGAAFGGKHVLVGHNSTRTLVLSDLHMQRGQIYRNRVAGGRVFVENCSNRTDRDGRLLRNAFHFVGQKVWIRYANPEYSGAGEVIADASDLWLAGYKTESWPTDFIAINGARVEVMGGVTNHYGDGVWPGEPPVYVDIDSQISVSFVTSGPDLEAKNPEVLIQESRRGDTRTLERGEVAPRPDLNRVVPLFRGFPK